MSATADAVSRAFVGVWRLLFDVLDGAWLTADAGVIAGVSGFPLPTLNGVWPTDATTIDVGGTNRLLDRVATSGLGYCLQVRPAHQHDGERIAADRAMTKLEPIPLMALDASARRAHGEEIRVEQLAADQGDVHADIAARAFGAPIDVFRRLAAPEILGLSELRAYVGLVDDVPVTTAMAVTQGAFVGIFNVGTPEEHRRHGHGAAVTARAAADGFAAGARTAWLQSSAAGYGVYERLGFRTLEAWSCWVSSANE